MIFKQNPTKSRHPHIFTCLSETLTIERLSCEHCEQTVEVALESVSGVRTAEADKDAEQATIDGDADTDAVVAAAEDAGDDVTADGRNSIAKFVAG